MEEETTETKYCSNCRRDIPAANFVIHVTHCQRNLTLCKVCGEPVPTSQQEEHFEEYHTEVKCECGQRLEKMNLEEHKETTCPNRLVDCQFCELQLPFCKLTTHVDYCGSRTEKCDVCDRFIQKKDFEMHVETGCQHPVKEERKKTPPQTPDESYMYSDTPGGMLGAMGLSESPESFLDAAKFFPFMPGMREFQQILNTGLGEPPFGGTSYFGADPAFSGRDVVARGMRPKPLKPNFDENGLDDFSDFDGNFIQQTDDDEMLAAAYQAGGYDSANGVDRMPPGMINGPFPKMSSLLPTDSSSDATELPCEFCGSLLPMDALILHQSGCQLKSMDSLPDIASTGHYADSHKHISRQREFDDYETEVDFDDDRRGAADVTFLPCEFCEELFPCDNLIQHQAICDASPASLLPAVIRNGPLLAPLNNTRSPVRQGPQDRPSRPVYESRKKQKPVEDFIPNELDDLDFTPKDTGRKPEDYYHRFDERGGTAMNNELRQRTENKTSDDLSRGTMMLRNNDLVNRQPSGDVPRVKNRTPNPKKPQPKPKAVIAANFNKSAKPVEDGTNRRKMSSGAKSEPASDLMKPVRLPQTNDSSAYPRPQKSSRDFTALVKGDPDPKIPVEMNGKSEVPMSKPLRSDSGKVAESPSAVQSAVSQSRKAKDILPAIKRSGDSAAYSNSSNPHRNPPTVTSETVRSNRGRPQALQQTSSEFQSRNTQTAASKRKSSTRKKIV